MDDLPSFFLCSSTIYKQALRTRSCVLRIFLKTHKQKIGSKSEASWKEVGSKSLVTNRDRQLQLRQTTTFGHIEPQIIRKKWIKMNNVLRPQLKFCLNVNFVSWWFVHLGSTVSALELSLWIENILDIYLMNIPCVELYLKTFLGAFGLMAGLPTTMKGSSSKFIMPKQWKGEMWLCSCVKGCIEIFVLNCEVKNIKMSKCVSKDSSNMQKSS